MRDGESRERGRPPHPVSVRAAAGSAGPWSPCRPRSRRPRGWGAGRGRAGTLEARVANQEGLRVSRVPGAAGGRVERVPWEPWSGSADFSETAESRCLGRAWPSRRVDRRQGKRGGPSPPHAACALVQGKRVPPRVRKVPHVSRSKRKTGSDAIALIGTVPRHVCPMPCMCLTCLCFLPAQFIFPFVGK